MIAYFPLITPRYILSSLIILLSTFPVGLKGSTMESITWSIIPNQVMTVQERSIKKSIIAHIFNTIIHMFQYDGQRSCVSQPSNLEPTILNGEYNLPCNYGNQKRHIHLITLKTFLFFKISCSCKEITSNIYSTTISKKSWSYKDKYSHYKWDSRHLQQDSHSFHDLMPVARDLVMLMSWPASLF